MKKPTEGLKYKIRGYVRGNGVGVSTIYDKVHHTTIKRIWDDLKQPVDHIVWRGTCGYEVYSLLKNVRFS